jgi:hypothetical protein
LAFTGHLAQHKLEIIAPVFTTPELTGMAFTATHWPAPSDFGKQFRIFTFPARPIEAEPLHGNRVPVFQPTKTNLEITAPGQGGQFAGNVFGVVPGFLKTNAQMFTTTGWHFGAFCRRLVLRP